MKNQSDTFANSESASGLPTLKVEKRVETSVSNNHLDTKFTADEVYTAVWFRVNDKNYIPLHLSHIFHSFKFFFPFVRNEYSFSCWSSLSISTTFKSNYIHMKQTQMEYSFFFAERPKLWSRLNDFFKRRGLINQGFKLDISRYEGP